ncbi:PDZ domain-containing protein [Edaphobacter sp. HDX4]|uniref:PDZ domain-containing protein n=1 Tax=Edaphobacter sp. HDX4 TaxID=2794064 RepID=UPI002FE5FE8A
MRYVRSFGVLIFAGLGLVTEHPSLAQSRLMHPQAIFRIIGPSSKSPQGYLGVDIRDVSDDRLATLKMTDKHGAEIVGVDHDAPACKAGMQLHDVILKMNGQAIDGETQLRHLLREIPAGGQVTFVISREGQQKTIQTQLADRNEVEREAWDNHYTVPEPASGSSAFSHAGHSFLSTSRASSVKGTRTFLGTTMLVSSSYTGAKLEVMGPQLADFFGAQGSSGLLVRSVEAHSPAADAGMRAGDVVIKINSLDIVNGSDWSKTIHENRGKSVSVVVLRDKKVQNLTLVPDSRKRSSVEPWASLEGFFGNSPQALETRETLAQIEPVLNAMDASLRNTLQEDRNAPEMHEMKAKLDLWSINPEFRRQMQLARQQVTAAADRMRAEPPALRDHVQAVHAKLDNVVRLD